MLSYTVEGKVAKKSLTPDWKGVPNEQSDPNQAPMDWWFEDLCMLDMDYFVRTIAAIRAKGVSPDMIGAVISNYAMKWLPGLAQEQQTSAYLLENLADAKEIIESAENENSTGKNKFILETLVNILPPEKDVVPCSFLLRLLRMAQIVGADTLYKEELERRVGFQLEQASLSDLLIPSFNSHTSDTMFDVKLVYRIVRCFLANDELTGGGDGGSGSGSGSGHCGRSAMSKVAKLLDSYLAEVAQDANLGVSDFEALAEALPSYARTCDDGLYRAIDTYLKGHPGITDAERKKLCRLMECKKLSVDACMHAAQNERLPIRTVVQLLFCDQMKLKNVKTAERITAPSLPNERGQCLALGYENPNFSSRRESEYDIRSVHHEIKKLREDFSKLQKMCNLMQQQVDKISKQKSNFPWSNGWKKITQTFISSSHSNSMPTNNAVQGGGQCSDEDEFSPHSPQQTRTRRKGKWRRNSVS